MLPCESEHFIVPLPAQLIVITPVKPHGVTVLLLLLPILVTRHSPAAGDSGGVTYGLLRAVAAGPGNRSTAMTTPGPASQLLVPTAVRGCCCC